jgi:hypothetical protein
MSTFTSTNATVRFTDTDDQVSFTATTGAVTFAAAYQSVTGGGGAVDSVNGETGVVVLDVDDVDGRDIYRPALVMSPTSVTAFGGSMVNGVSLTIAALASSVPTGSDILIWNGTNGGAPNGSYTHSSGGNFNYATRQYLNATSFGNGCVEVMGNDFATTGSDGELSTWAISTVNGTEFGLSAQSGQAFQLTYGPSSPSDGFPALFDTSEGNWLKQGTALGGQLAAAALPADARTALGLGSAAVLDSTSFAAASHVHAASDVTSGTMATARLGSGSATSSTFLRGDQTYATPTVDVVSNVATSTILGRTTSGSGDSEELTAAQVRTLLGSGWVDLYDTTLGSDTASIQVTVTGYSVIRFTFAGRSTRASTSDSLRMTVNSLSTSIYSTNAAATATNGIILGNEIPATTTNTDRAAVVTGQLHFLSGFRPSGWSNATSHLSTSTTSGNGRIIGHEIGTTTAITTVEFFMLNGPNIASGSRLIVSAR